MYPAFFRYFALSLLLFLGAYIWGASTFELGVFPYRIIQDAWKLYKGADNETVSLSDKLINDLQLRPKRFVHNYGLDDAQRNYPELFIEHLKSARHSPRMFLSKKAPRGFRMIFGAFDFEETLWGALLIGPDGKLLKQWTLSTDDLPQSTEPSYRKNMYGVDVRPDGSILFLMQEAGGGILSVDWCGHRNWVLDGMFHHAISPDDSDTFWTFEGSQGAFDHILAKVDAKTGKILKRINMADVRQANPNVNIFDLQRIKNQTNKVHGNDIEPLRRRVAGKFPQFEQGDLLISFHTVNLLFVLDPDSLHIKWWRIGPWDRQHDPDWEPDGKISVFSNNWRSESDYSNIVSISPEDYKTRIILKGEKYNFYSVINGKHQITPSGTILVTSATQGRVFEVDANGDVVFDFVNVYSAADNETLHLSDAIFLPLDYFEFDPKSSCPDS